MSTTLKIQSDSKELLVSQSFIMIGEEGAKIYLDELEFTFEFVYVGEKKHDPQMSFAPSGEKSLKFTLTNWDNTLGTGVTTPLEIGTISSKKLYLVFWIAKLGNKGNSRKMDVSFYVGEEVKDGED